jgi:mannitol-1-phosphate/altronate dehydrogenase
MPKILVIGAGNFSIGALEKLLDLAKHPDDFKITNIRANSKRYDTIRHQPFFLYEAGIIDEQPVSRIKKIDISKSTLPPIETDSQPTIKEALKSDIIFTSVTENGLNLKNKILDFDNENIKHDISEPDNPKSVQGICAYALYQKYEAHKRGENVNSLTVIPLENLEDNGKILRSSIVSLIEAQKVMVDEEGKIDKDFTSWLRQGKGLICCNTIVDRICPDLAPKEGENGSRKALYNQVRNSIIEDYQDKDPLIFAAELPVGRMHIMIECQNDVFGKELLEDFKKSDISIVRNVKPYSEVKRKVLNSSVHFLGAVIGAYQGKDAKTGEKYKYINKISD